MNTMTEDTLVQQTTADYLLNDLQWDESVYGMDEVLGKEGTLGRESEKEMVLSRYLGEALMRLNPDLPEEAYRDAMRQINTIGTQPEKKRRQSIDRKLPHFKRTDCRGYRRYSDHQSCPGGD